MHGHPSRFKPAPLTLALAMILGIPGLAQSQTAIDDKPIAISIAAKPLGDALHELSNSTGIPIAFAPSLVAGKTAPAVTGTLTARQALTRLLAGSGLEAQQDGGSVIIRAAELTPAEATLPTVKVTAQAEKDGTTEGTGSYTASYTNTATKLNLTPRETPQTVTVITRQQMDDSGMTLVEDALGSAAGVTVVNRELNGSNFLIRGFSPQTQYDGVPNPIGISQNSNGPSIDTAFLDRVDILQGASGLASGAGNPGGTINLIRKRPTSDFQATAEAQLGSWDRRRFVGDVSGRLVDSGAIRGRLVAMYDDGNSFVNYEYNNRKGLYGIVEADLTPTTLLSVSVQHQKNKVNSSAIPFSADGSDLGLDRSTYFGSPRKSAPKDNTLYTLALEQKLSESWMLRATYMHASSTVKQRNYSYMDGSLDIQTGDGLTLHQMGSFRKDLSSNAFDVYASGPFNLFDRQHELVFGVNGSVLNLRGAGGDYYDTAINAYSFNPSSLIDPPDTITYTFDEKTTQYGAYAASKFNISDSLKLILGTRISNYLNKDPVAGIENAKKNGVISPYGGLLYDINKQYTAYASYSDIFNPQSARQASGSYLKPVVGANYEIGIKGQLFDGKLNLNAALFRLEQTNLAAVDGTATPDQNAACGGYCYIAVDKVVSQGVDLGVSGQVQPGWNISASYSYVDSKYASGDNNGLRYNDNMPQHQIRFATAYRIPSTGLTVGGNVRLQSKFDSNGTTYWGSPQPGVSIHQGGLAIFGLIAKYQINSHAEVNFVANNIFDKRYYSTINYLWYGIYGNPRNASINLKYSF
ncbi:MAG: TonB-dependent siderophore receptor [Burkholderiaceae bacterium]